MTSQSHPTHAIVKEAFIKLVYEYNANPIEEIKEPFSKIHKEYMNSKGIDYAYGNSIHSHVDITKATETTEFREKYPEFIQLWGTYMKLQLEYNMYKRSELEEFHSRLNKE